ncbi:uncharacterized protein LOC108051278 [Drosophila rhopaloa]|uniref:Uncharacterized protein LOC108051278 n=1 Tax=Drosophila rhopaloa TaxID=1041015 RepID=A0A6P4FMU6_DRORH|nr:uncharacterized protein LOC108051278 [Drosophila rhopaloa]XP_016988823.1 uncharacterized protein LOC108051278 [Drosophila rhopaloa]
MSDHVNTETVKKLKVKLKDIARALQNQDRSSQGVMIVLNGSGTFVFPVSFKTFLNSLNIGKVFSRITKTREQCLELMGDSAFFRSTLQKFYNRFYMIPEKRSGLNFFKDELQTPLAQLLEFGKPLDEMAVSTVQENNNNNEDNDIVICADLEKSIELRLQKNVIIEQEAADEQLPDLDKSIELCLQNNVIIKQEAADEQLPQSTCCSPARELPQAEDLEKDSEEAP